MKFTILFFLASATLAVATPEMQTKRSIQARDPRIDLERMVIRSGREVMLANKQQTKYIVKDDKRPVTKIQHELTTLTLDTKLDTERRCRNAAENIWGDPGPQ
ncbi:hypothetical protein BYT27DRAFT_7238540 [Phlegmacium glaucopus]|nr:hypothetical protein BYT27DRAFT_7238540 [Phlegmacium glaucopus]